MLPFVLLACDDGAKSPGTDDTASDCTPLEWTVDADGDGYGGTAPVLACEAPDDVVTDGGDCDDGDATVSPVAAEVCDGLDQDCDGLVDDDLPLVAFGPDGDGDGFGDTALAELACAAPDGWVDATDCDDTNAAINPDAQEVCNLVDDDCDALVDGDDPSMAGTDTWYFDGDADGFGAGDAVYAGCEPPAGYVATGDDCDDDDATIHPGATEVCFDALDQDCDGYTDDYSLECDPGTPDTSDPLCDAAASPGDVSLCTPGVAALLAGGTYSTVQEALDASSANDVVTVCPGTWTESLSVTTSPLYLVGFGSGTSILTAPGRVITLDDGAEFTIAGLTVEGGVTDDAGGGLYGTEATVCITGSAFSDNSAATGGAIALDGEYGSLYAEASTFEDNTASGHGGAISLDGLYFVLIEDTAVRRNDAGDDGGGLAMTGVSFAEIDNSTFTGNTTDHDGAGIWLDGYSTGSMLYLQSVAFETNNARINGGAVSVQGGGYPSNAMIIGSTFHGNEAAHGAAIGIGSSSGPETTYLQLFTSTLDENRANGSGGGVWLGGDTPGLFVEGTTFHSNEAFGDGGGGAIRIDGDGAELALVAFSTFEQNENTAITFDYDATLYVLSTDFGTGADANAPSDVLGAFWGAGATFQCTAGVCI